MTELASVGSLLLPLRQASDLAQSRLREPSLDEGLAKLIQAAEKVPGPSHKELFFRNGVPLPCWIEGDTKLEDGWLTGPNYYPKYYALIHSLAKVRPRLRFLEIGVRTGYMGVVFAQAAGEGSFYTGIDPNRYVVNGLSIAGRALSILRDEIKGFHFSLVEGHSWESAVQRSMEAVGPFDLIHIDGAHTPIGKLIDLELASRLVTKDGLVLVDDYEYHPFIRDSVKRSLAMGWFSRYGFIKTIRGLAVLAR